jgi:hypothetical protein
MCRFSKKKRFLPAGKTFLKFDTLPILVIVHLNMFSFIVEGVAYGLKDLL